MGWVGWVGGRWEEEVGGLGGSEGGEGGEEEGEEMSFGKRNETTRRDDESEKTHIISLEPHQISSQHPLNQLLSH